MWNFKKAHIDTDWRLPKTGVGVGKMGEMGSKSKKGRKKDTNAKIDVTRLSPLMKSEKL